jgi:hypothetical protein
MKVNEERVMILGYILELPIKSGDLEKQLK